jgi:hypothetical protein
MAGSWIWAGAGAVAVLAAVLVGSYFRPALPAPDIVRFLVPPPDKTGFDVYVAMSPISSLRSCFSKACFCEPARRLHTASRPMDGS